jgi:hypothetical protein
MANTFAPFGFQQLKGTGSAPTYEQVVGLINYTNTTPIFFNDPVVIASGYLIQGDNGTSSPIAGIFVGCKYLSVSQKRTVWSNYWPGSDSATPVEAYYLNDPNAQFLVQVGGSGAGPVTQAQTGLNIGYNVGTGNTANGISGAYVTYSSVNTTATLPFRIVSLSTNVPAIATGAGAVVYSPTAANNYIVVAFNAVETKSLTAI